MYLCFPLRAQAVLDSGLRASELSEAAHEALHVIQQMGEHHTQVQRVRLPSRPLRGSTHAYMPMYRYVPMHTVP